MTLRGFNAVLFLVDDVAAATRWYTEFLGVPPVFTRPGRNGEVVYAKFAVGDDGDELALADRSRAPGSQAAGPAGAVVHWRVDDVAAALARLTAMGAREHAPVTPHGPFVTAIVVDPFGNLLGLHGVLATPHYRDEDLEPARAN
jgi:catechol 2,3-dioxygenase-like lactoylglutathione lyase family enzyme